jgi:hypothetical protein
MTKTVANKKKSKTHPLDRKKLQRTEECTKLEKGVGAFCKFYIKQLKLDKKSAGKLYKKFTKPAIELLARKLKSFILLPTNEKISQYKNNAASNTLQWKDVRTALSAVLPSDTLVKDSMLDEGERTVASRVKAKAKAQ